MMTPIIEPMRLPGEPELPACGLLLLNPSEAAAAAKNMAGKGAGWQQHHLFNSQLFVAPPLFWAGPAVGAPMAVLTLEKLIALGARRLLVLGWCGALTAPLAAGEVLLPTWAASEEGTSAHYPVAHRPESSPPLREALHTVLIDAGFAVAEGPIWTTDAPYRETREEVRRYATEGVRGVDMEYAALCTVAAFRGVELAAAMLVSDELYHATWQPRFHTKAFRRQSRRLLEALFAFGQGLTKKT